MDRGDHRGARVRRVSRADRCRRECLPRRLRTELPGLSPDGQRLATVFDGDVWIYEIARGAMTRLTFDPNIDDMDPVWSPDGQYLAFSSIKHGTPNIYLKPANGSGTAQHFLKSVSKANVMPLYRTRHDCIVCHSLSIASYAWHGKVTMVSGGVGVISCVK